MAQDERYERAKKRVKELRTFYSSLAIYVVVMIVLFIVDYSDRGNWWVYWPAMGWGIAVVLHAFRVFGPGGRNARSRSSWSGTNQTTRRYPVWLHQLGKAQASRRLRSSRHDN